MQGQSVKLTKAGRMDKTRILLMRWKIAGWDAE